MVLLVAVLLLWSRRLSLVDAFGLAAVVGRMWTYHKNYDNVVLLFVILPLAVRVWRSRSSLPGTLVLFLLCFSLVLPSRFLEPPAIQVLQNLLWMGAAAVIIARQSADDPGPCGLAAPLPPSLELAPEPPPVPAT
jgi:hypothetical protein